MGGGVSCCVCCGHGHFWEMTRDCVGVVLN